VKGSRGPKTLASDPATDGMHWERHISGGIFSERYIQREVYSARGIFGERYIRREVYSARGIFSERYIRRLGLSRKPP
jgi:hypothetical protein